MKKIPHQSIIIPAAIAAGAACLLLLPMTVPYCISVPGKIMPEREWILVRAEDGLLSSSVHNNILDFAESRGNSVAERGDQASFRFHPDMLTREAVTAEDTIGFVYSYEVEYKWAQLKGELETEIAALRLSEAGEKEPLVREARHKLEYAEKQAEQQEREVARLDALAEKEMIPPAEIERARNTLQLFEIQVNAEQAALDALETGSRKEETALARTRIAALEREIYVMEKRMRFSTILTPIPGRLVRFAESDTLAIVQDTSRYIAVFPVKWKDRAMIRPGRRLRLKCEGRNIHASGRIEHTGGTVVFMNGQHLMRVAAVIDEGVGELSPGLVVTCSVACPRVRLHEYLLLYLRQ